MATVAELLATSLEKLKEFQERTNRTTIVKNGDLSRLHISRLVKHQFLRPVIKGWYFVSDPKALPGDSTAWYASFWHFIARYATERYGKEWCLSAEQSLVLHSGSTIIPRQVLVRSPKANDYAVALIPPTSVFHLGAELPERIDTDNPYGLNLYPLSEAIIAATPAMYRGDALTMRTALAMIKDGSEILRILADTGQSVRAGRVIGAFRNVGREEIADEMSVALKRIGYEIREENPFEETFAVLPSPSPYVSRLRLMWERMRQDVLTHFACPRTHLTADEILKRMEARYRQDAYHSLSIEGYRVTDSLIGKVRSGIWQPDGEDTDAKNALAARGYWQAFQAVKTSVTNILKGGGNAATTVAKDLPVWYAEMFMPCVTAGIIKPSDIVGYRSQQVYIRNSIHTPLPAHALVDAMTTLHELIAAEPEASVRAVLGHFFFTYIHPYMDGNGRMGRFLMNTMLVSGGYDWLIVPSERRNEYMQALEEASTGENIVPFVRFLSSIHDNLD